MEVLAYIIMDVWGCFFFFFSTNVPIVVRTLITVLKTNEYFLYRCRLRSYEGNHLFSNGDPKMELFGLFNITYMKYWVWMGLPAPASDPYQTSIVCPLYSALFPGKTRPQSNAYTRRGLTPGTGGRPCG